MIRLRSGSATDVGRVRDLNQDQLLVADSFFAVADGMGGAAAGEVASAVAIEAFRAAFAEAGEATPDHLVEAAQTANRAVWDRADANPEMRGMGTTLVALALVSDGQLAVVNCGDSRLYALHGDDFRQVTSDHNLVAEMVAEGRISREQAEVHPRRNVVTRVLGVDPDVSIDLFMEEARPGDRYLLCSDGLPREVSDDYIASLLRRTADPGEAARALVDEAIRRGGNDNITVIVVDVVDSDAVGTESDKDDTVALVRPAPGAAPDAAAVEADAPAKRSRRSKRQGAERPPRTRPITLRVVAFVILFLLVVGGGGAALAWYARASYFVGLSGNKLVVYKGRPGRVLWFKPTVAEPTTYTTSDILPASIPALRSGQEEPSLSASHQYIHNLLQEKLQADAAALPPVLPTTTRPTSPTTARSTATTRPPASRSKSPATT